MLALTILLATNIVLGASSDIDKLNDDPVFYISKNGSKFGICKNDSSACDKIESVILNYSKLNRYLIKLDNYMHDLDLGYIVEKIKNFQHKMPVEIALYGVDGTIVKLFNDTQPLENIQINAHDLTLDITDVKLENFLRGSYNELTNVKIVRDEGQTAINQISIISAIDFKTLLDYVTIDGELKDGLEPLFQIGKTTQFTLNNSLIKNIRIIGQEYDQTIMRIDNLNSDSLVTIENTVISDIYSDSPNSQLILVEFSNPIVITPTTKPILIIKGSTFQNSNNLSSLGNLSADVKLVDVNPELFKFINNTFNNVKSIEENEKDYEIMIYLTQGYTAGDVIPRFAGFLYNHNIKPIIIYEFGSTIPKFIFPGSYEYLTINSNSGTISCTKYDEDYNDEIKTLSCAMIIIRGQDSIDQLRLSKRSIEIEGEFSEIDLRTDGQLITFLGSNHIAASNQITFRPSVGSQPNDSLFRVTNGGELNLDSIQVTRIRSFIGAEEIPIVSVVPESGKYGQITSIPGILILTNSIISGTGSFSEKWSGKGINEICNLNYAPLIVGSSTGTVTLIGTTVTQSEGAGIYVYGGAQLSIDSTSTLISNGERVGSSLSGMQTHVVCNGIDASGYPITTSVEINSNALPSYSTNQETWVFADSFKECNSIIITPGGNIVGRIAPQATSGSITIKSNESGSKTVQTTVTGNNLNPCDRILFLEVRNQYGQTILSQNLNESSSNAAGAQWEGIDKFSLELPSSSFTDATSESKFSLRVVEYRKESQYDWVDASLNFDEQASPTEEEQQSNSSGLSLKWRIGLAMGISTLAIIIAAIIIICVEYNLNRKKEMKKKESEIRKENEKQNWKENQKDNENQIYKKQVKIKKNEKSNNIRKQEYIENLNNNVKENIISDQKEHIEESQINYEDKQYIEEMANIKSQIPKATNKNIRNKEKIKKSKNKTEISKEKLTPKGNKIENRNNSIAQDRGKLMIDQTSRQSKQSEGQIENEENKEEIIFGDNEEHSYLKEKEKYEQNEDCLSNNIVVSSFLRTVTSFFPENNYYSSQNQLYSSSNQKISTNKDVK